MLKNSVMLFLVFLLLFVGCAVNPITGKKDLMLVSSSQELEIGRQYSSEIEKQLGGRIPDTLMQNYINGVGKKIALVSHMGELEFRFVALNDKSVNAMALPGGYVFITAGMLGQLSSEDQLAAILAHEIVHVTARHAANAMSNQIGLGILLSAVTSEETGQGTLNVAQLGSQLIGLTYSRDHETQADIGGVDYMVKAGYNPLGMVETMEILERQRASRKIEFLSTHPSPANRRQRLEEAIAEKGYFTETQSRRKDYDKYVRSKL